MTRFLYLLAGLLCLLALSAGSAQAGKDQLQPIAFGVEFTDDPVACPVFGLAFDMLGPKHSVLGTGQSCIAGIEDGCLPFFVGCKVVIDATLTLRIPGRGTLTVPVVLTEFFFTPTRFIQIGVGTITGGTGEFAGASGTLTGGGIAAFNEFGGVDGTFLFVIRFTS